MRGQTTSALSLIIALTIASTITVLSAGNAASAAANCLSSPKGAAPEGRHWYYNTDRSLQRKCWYLAAEDQEAANETTRAVPRSKRVAKAAAPRTAMEPPDEAAPQPRDGALITKQASDVAPDDALVILPPPDTTQQQPAAMTTPTEQTQAPTPKTVGQTQAVNNVPAPSPAAEPPAEHPAERPAAQQPVAAHANLATDTPADTRMLQFVFLALAIIGLLGGAILYISEIRRRRNDVLLISPGTNANARKVRVTVEGPAAPVPSAKSKIQQRGDVEQALERLSQLAKRRAA